MLQNDYFVRERKNETRGSMTILLYLLVAVYVDDKYEYDMAARSTHYRAPMCFRAGKRTPHEHRNVRFWDDTANINLS